MVTDDALRAGVSGAHWSIHAQREADNDDLSVAQVLEALASDLRILRIYPEDRQGESALVLTHLADGRALHAVIGCGRVPWTIVTVYLPDPERWNWDFTERRR